jgi:hypothetical protein
MTWNADLAILERVLDEIEKHEAKVLVWGLVDAALSFDELRSIVTRVINGPDVRKLMRKDDCTLFDEDAVIGGLRAHGLLFEAPFEIGYRSRMAESVRLFSRLRQMFPKHAEGDLWASAPTLVADYRLLWRSRKYPDRNIGIEQALVEFAELSLSAATFGALSHRLREEACDWELARFQVEATKRVLRGFEEGIAQGTMVAAGTGSGKTLAFYLPGLSAAAADVWRSEVAGTRILAIYPRNELLKDQFAEVYSQARKFDAWLTSHGARKLTVGVLYGDTPRTFNSIRNSPSWKRTRSGYVCPFMRCARRNCSGDLHIVEADIDAKRSRLACAACGDTVESDEVLLTRDQMASRPPDVLFTSAEMLNQNMSNSELRHLFGIGPRAPFPPRMALLDEVHIYAGSYGAQVAYLLRRWSALTRYRASFVGLSATLSEGAAFFAALTGLDVSAVAEISPQAGEMKAEGAEYLLALRGDPVARTALLSTSIQALMLSSRILDPRSRVADSPFHGWRTFAFTDQMDSTNRLFLDLMDAEGMQANGRPKPRSPDGGLAHLREARPNRNRYEGGQDWRLPVTLGHQLNTRHLVSRTTSYDQGVSARSELVIATAALEVGYDDPHVGVVLQHKAPRDVAQFLQRKGRAGRTRHMRPWTVMVLSDYGRDRMAYQAYEQFFDPELPSRRLPIGNRYVMRMQAVYSLVDYLGREMQVGHPAGSVWRDLGRPFEPADAHQFSRIKPQLSALLDGVRFPLSGEAFDTLVEQAKRLATRVLGKSTWDVKNYLVHRLRSIELTRQLSALLNDKARQTEFVHFLRRGMRLTEAQAQPLLWNHPRPVFLGAIPTALRRIASNWRSTGGPRDYASGAPLPEFIPAALFSDLSLPEVELRLPGGEAGGDAYRLPVLQALSEMAPGKVSRRFDHALWLAPDDATVLALAAGAPAEQAVDVRGWYELEPLPDIVFWNGAAVERRRSFRPNAMALRPTPKEVGDTSNAQLRWISQMFAENEGAGFQPPASIGLAQLVEQVVFHTHALQSPGIVRRYAVASRADLRIKVGNTNETYEALWHFEADGAPCGVGFELECDAAVFVLRIPQSASAQFDWEAGMTGRALRQCRYLWEARHGHVLRACTSNIFRREWLAQIFLTTATVHAIDESVALSDAIAALSDGRHGESFERVLASTFQSPLPTDGDNPDKLRQELSDDLADVDVLAALAETAQVLVAPIDASWDAWLEASMRQTLAAGVFEAIQQFCPELTSDQLVVDIEPGLRQDGTMRAAPEIWISEVNPGGNGLIEQFYASYAEQPERFFRLVEAALASSEFEVVDAQLRDVVQRLGGLDPEPELVDKVLAVRSAPTVQAADDAYLALRRALLERGISVFHGFASALSSRILRRDMPPAFDRLLHELLCEWDRIESTLGIEVDARVIATLYSEDTRIEDELGGAGFGVPAAVGRDWRFNVLYGLLWARGNQLRSASLQLQNRFAPWHPATERLLLAPWASVPEQPIDAAASDWHAQAAARLAQRGRAVLAVPLQAHERMHEVFAWSIAEPVQSEYLNLYPRLAGVRRHDAVYEFQFELRESM